MLRERKPLTVVIAYHPGDQKLAKELLHWIGFLGACKTNNCLLVSDVGVDSHTVGEMQEVARCFFAQVDVAFNLKPTPGWIPGSNSLFLSAAGWCYDRKVPWLWLEPDCVPLCANWLPIIQDEYYNAGREFMGHIYDGEGANKGRRFISGIGVYPETALNLLSAAVMKAPETAFDVTASKLLVTRAHNATSIQHFWGESNLPPTFASLKEPGSPRNTLTTGDLRPGAVLFHRSKDGTLIELLSRRVETNPMMVVYPFCNKDCQMAVKNMQWICDLAPRYPFDIVLSYEAGTQTQAIADMERLAKSSFRSVRMFQYPGPQNGEWPPTVAFKAAANHMQVFGRPWLWMEFDAIPLKPNWLEVLQAAYFAKGKPFAGPVVPQLGHMNGTAIYPADTPRRIPQALNLMHTAWDTAAKGEQIDQVNNIQDIYQHVWGVNGGGFHPFMGGPPSFPKGSPLLAEISPNAVMFHRCKDGTLIDRLRERRPKP